MTDSANLALVRSIFAAWEGGNFSSAVWADPQIELVFVDGPSPGRWTGLTGLAQGRREWASAWEESRVAAEDYRELDEERVLVLTRRSGRGKASGLEIAQMRPEGASIFHVRDGRVTRHVLYFDRDRALADLGLKE
jgi:ketosteroid isomerase-like protein